MTLQDGPTLPVEVMRLAWRLEDQGFTFEVVNDTLRLGRIDGVPAAERLSAEDRSDIVKWKKHLLVVVSYARQQM